MSTGLKVAGASLTALTAAACGHAPTGIAPTQEVLKPAPLITMAPTQDSVAQTDQQERQDVERLKDALIMVYDVDPSPENLAKYRDAAAKTSVAWGRTSETRENMILSKARNLSYQLVEVLHMKRFHADKYNRMHTAAIQSKAQDARASYGGR